LQKEENTRSSRLVTYLSLVCDASHKSLQISVSLTLIVKEAK